MERNINHHIAFKTKKQLEQAKIEQALLYGKKWDGFRERRVIVIDDYIRVRNKQSKTL